MFDVNSEGLIFHGYSDNDRIYEIVNAKDKSAYNQWFKSYSTPFKYIKISKGKPPCLMTFENPLYSREKLTFRTTNSIYRSYYGVNYALFVSN